MGDALRMLFGGRKIPVEVGADIEEMLARAFARAEIDAELRRRVGISLGAREFEKSLDKWRLRLGNVYHQTLSAGSHPRLLSPLSYPKWSRAIVIFRNIPTFNPGGATFTLSRDPSGGAPGVTLEPGDFLVHPAADSEELFGEGSIGVANQIEAVHYGFGIPPAYNDTP